jgi:hypothetical protein
MQKLFLLAVPLLLSACSYRPGFMASVDPVPVQSVELAPVPAPELVTQPVTEPVAAPAPVESRELGGTPGVQ